MQRHRNFNSREHRLKSRSIRNHDIDAAAFFILENGSVWLETNRNKTNPGNSPRVQVGGELWAVHPWRADDFERSVGPAADGNVCRLEQADAGIQCCFRQTAHIRRRIDPREAR